MQDGMLRSASIRSAKTPTDSLGCLQDDPKTPQRRPPGRPRRTQSAPKTAPRRTTTPSGWSQLRPAAPKVAKKPSKPRFWTLWTSILDPPDLDFGPSIFDPLDLELHPFKYRTLRGGGLYYYKSIILSGICKKISNFGVFIFFII